MIATRRKRHRKLGWIIGVVVLVAALAAGALFAGAQQGLHALPSDPRPDRPAAGQGQGRGGRRPLHAARRGRGHLHRGAHRGRREPATDPPARQDAQTGLEALGRALPGPTPGGGAVAHGDDLRTGHRRPQERPPGRGVRHGPVQPTRAQRPADLLVLRDAGEPDQRTVRIDDRPGAVHGPPARRRPHHHLQFGHLRRGSGRSAGRRAQRHRGLCPVEHGAGGQRRLHQPPRRPAGPLRIGRRRHRIERAADRAVPNVLDDTVAQATAALEAAGFKVAGVDGNPTGTVVATDPAIGTTQNVGSSVTACRSDRGSRRELRPL